MTIVKRPRLKLKWVVPVAVLIAVPLVLRGLGSGDI